MLELQLMTNLILRMFLFNWFFSVYYTKNIFFSTRAGVGLNEVAKNNNLNQKDNLANVEGDFKNLALQFSLGYRF